MLLTIIWQQISVVLGRAGMLLKSCPAIIKNIITGWLDLVYPRLCVLCHKYIMPTEARAPLLCGECWSAIIANRPPFCAKCSRPLQSFQDIFCGHCRQTSVYFDQAWAAAIYNENLRRLIHLFKYGGKTSLRLLFGDLILTFIRTYHVPVQEFDFIVPVPLYHVRYRERGYNQARILAEIVSKAFEIPVLTQGLQRIRNTKNQARLSPKERWTNIDGAFKMRTLNFVIDRNILIVDDLFTTGATASEIARVLKAAGAKKVSVLTLAITALAKET